ncbi:MAG: type II/IV secretion system ATPase subunit [Candidatus Aenigmatarchaeota archaeon]
MNEKEIRIPEKLEDLNISYELIKSFAYAHIFYDKNLKSIVYEVVEPQLSDSEKKQLEKIKELILEYLDVNIIAIKDREKLNKLLEDAIKKVLKILKIKIDSEILLKFCYYISRDFIGLGKIEPLMSDPYIEDISCSGINIPIYVTHRYFGNIRTNIIFNDVDELKEFIIKLAQRCGRHVSYAEPILEGSLPDGSRVSATFSEEVSQRGPSFTIRKFTEKPFSPIELVELKTINIEALAYLWFLIEHKISFLIIGGVGSGKTSLLNSLGIFIKPEAKIVSIEDTRELRFMHEHWVPLVTRTGFGLPLPTGSKYGEVNLFDLLRESFRMNPDYVIVGETRGKEVYVMFQGMASGHASASTFHAEDVTSLVKRLISPPIELPVSLLEALDLIIVMRRAREKGEFARRVQEIVEIVGLDEKGNIMQNIVFRWNPFEDILERINESILISRICEKFGLSLESAKKEIEDRKKVLEWLLKNGRITYEEVAEIIKLYYKDKKSLMKIIEEKIEYEEAKKIILKLKENLLAKKLGYIFVIES